jgi:hypothetical protein
VMSASDRRLCERGLPPADFESGLRAAPQILRQNLRRLAAAAWMAEALGVPLVTVEGWRSNAVARRRGRATRFVTGSWWFAAWSRVLERRGLITRPRIVRRDVSRCTWEEARGLVAIAQDAPVIGVSDTPCPSASRAARYLRRGDEVLTPAAAIARSGRPLSGAQAAFWSALQPTRRESRLAAIVEAPNWIVHGTSELVRLVMAEPPLEARLARALRADRRP